jgi:hypothetical protein
MIISKQLLHGALALSLLALYPAPLTFANNINPAMPDVQINAESMDTVQASDDSVLVTTFSSSEKSTIAASSLERPPNDATKRPNDATSRPNDATNRPNDATSRPNDATDRPNDATLRPNDATRRPNTTASNR